MSLTKATVDLRIIACRKYKEESKYTLMNLGGSYLRIQPEKQQIEIEGFNWIRPQGTTVINLASQPHLYRVSDDWLWLSYVDDNGLKIDRPIGYWANRDESTILNWLSEVTLKINAAISTSTTPTKPKPRLRT